MAFTYLKKFNAKIDDKYVLFIFVALISSIWSLKLFVEWGSDFGVYYSLPYFLDENYRLYKEAFSHKGPVYLLFTYILGGLMGWGAIQAYLTLVATIATYFFSILYVISNRTKNFTIKTVVLLISLLILGNTTTNASISLFLTGLIILSLYFLVESLNNNNLIFFLFSVTIFTLSVLTRIDALFLLPAFIVILMLMHLNGLSVNGVLIFFFSGLTVASIIFYAISVVFGFTLDEYILHNIYFNLQYKNQNTPGIKPFVLEHIQALFSTGITPFFILILGYIVKELFLNHDHNNKSYLFNRKIIKQQLLVSILVFFLGYALWVYSNSGKSYHIYSIATPLLFFIAFWGDYVATCSKYLALLAVPLMLYLSFYPLKAGANVLINHRNCIHDIYCNASPVSLYKETIEQMSKRDSSAIVGGRGWPHLFSNSKPELSMNNWWIYYRKETFMTDYLLKGHEKLITRPSGYIFWIDKIMTTGDNRSIYFSQVLSASTKLSVDGKYIRVYIK
ncbi:hypothetical protein OAJ98_01855 [Deltaproteobacteria bacterium]|nr:hypothetical protein [Deltaproteobacteria bacterium]